MMKFLFGLMTFLVAAILLVLPVSAHAASVEAKGQGFTVTLHDTACAEQDILANIKDEFKADFRQAAVIYQGKKLRACWTTDESIPGQVFIVDETKDSGTLPMGAFKPVGTGI